MTNTQQEVKQSTEIVPEGAQTLNKHIIPVIINIFKELKKTVSK